MEKQYRIRCALALVVFGATTAMTTPVLLTRGVDGDLVPLYAVAVGLVVGTLTLIVLLALLRSRRRH